MKKSKRYVENYGYFIDILDNIPDLDIWAFRSVLKIPDDGFKDAKDFLENIIGTDIEEILPLLVNSLLEESGIPYAKKFSKVLSIWILFDKEDTEELENIILHDCEINYSNDGKIILEIDPDISLNKLVNFIEENKNLIRKYQEKSIKAKGKKNKQIRIKKDPKRNEFISYLNSKNYKVLEMMASSRNINQIDNHKYILISKIMAGMGKNVTDDIVRAYHKKRKDYFILKKSGF